MRKARERERERERGREGEISIPGEFESLVGTGAALTPASLQRAVQLRGDREAVMPLKSVGVKGGGRGRRGAERLDDLI